MRVLAALLLAVLAGVAARTAEDLEKLPIEEFTKLANNELRALQNKRLLSDVQKPDCTFNKDEKEIKCSIGFRWMKRDRKVGLAVTFDPHRVALRFHISFDDKSLFSYTATLGELCAPLPGFFKFINICAQAYYVNIEVKPIFTFETCLLVKLGSVFFLDFNCLSIDTKGHFSHNSDYKPEDHGIFTMSIEDGNVKFEVNNPIPDAIMEKIEAGWDGFSDKAKLEVGKLVNKVEDKWDGAKDAVKEGFIDTKEMIGNAAVKVVDKIEDAWDKAKEKAKSAKDNLVGWVNSVFG